MGIQEANSRPSWDVYFITMSFVAAQRSIDKHTKCGCIIVSKDKRILSAGYNGPIKNSDDSLIPLERPDKYAWIIHSELNAILSYSGSSSDMEGATIYVTTRPCHNCTKFIIQKGIKTIVYCDIANAKCVDEKDMSVSDKMLEEHDVKVKIVQYEDVKKFLRNMNLEGINKINIES